jgi:hypothetical protein
VDFILNPNVIAAIREVLEAYGGEDAQKVAKILAILEKALRQLPPDNPRTAELRRQYNEIVNKAALYPTAPETTAVIKTFGHQLMDEAHIQQVEIAKRHYYEFGRDLKEQKRERDWALVEAKKERLEPSVLLYADKIIAALERFPGRDEALALCSFGIKVCDLCPASSGCAERKQQILALKTKIEATSTTGVNPVEFMQAVSLAKEALAAAKEAAMSNKE